MRVELSGRTADQFEIPTLDHPFLMELQVCGRVRTRDKKTAALLARLARSKIIAAISDEGLYVEVFGGCGIKNHLHVDITVGDRRGRPGMKTLTDVQKVLAGYTGKRADVFVRGEYFIEIQKLPVNGIVRSALIEKEAAGLLVKQTGQTLKFRDNKRVERLSWQLSSSEQFVTVAIDVKSSVVINPEYLRDCEAMVNGAFRALVHTEKSDASANQ
jgi:hypothetical protein